MTTAEADRRDLSTMSMRWLEVVIDQRERVIARHRREIAQLSDTPESEAFHWMRLDSLRRDLAWELSFYEESLAEVARRDTSTA